MLYGHNLFNLAVLLVINKVHSFKACSLKLTTVVYQASVYPHTTDFIRQLL